MLPTVKNAARTDIFEGTVQGNVAVSVDDVQIIQNQTHFSPLNCFKEGANAGKAHNSLKRNWDFDSPDPGRSWCP